MGFIFSGHRQKSWVFNGFPWVLDNSSRAPGGPEGVQPVLRAGGADPAKTIGFPMVSNEFHGLDRRGGALSFSAYHPKTLFFQWFSKVFE